MIDFATEKPISLKIVCDLYPGRKARLNFTTVWRWVMHGVKAPDGKRVRLEAARVGGCWLTSREALTRFSERLTPRLDGNADSPAPHTLRQTRRIACNAGAEPERRGV
jgi:hypothetical protein